MAPVLRFRRPLPQPSSLSSPTSDAAAGSPVGASPLALLEDEVLAERAAGGSQLAFGVLVARHQGALRTWLRRIGPTPDLADDIAQETFIAAWRQLVRWQGQGRFRSWLFAIAANKAADARRTAGRSAARDTRWQAERPLAFEPASALEASLDVDRALATLPEPQRIVVALCFGAGFSHQEAADILGLPLGTVKSHAARGRDRMLASLTTPEPAAAPQAEPAPTGTIRRCS